MISRFSSCGARGDAVIDAENSLRAAAARSMRLCADSVDDGSGRCL